MPILLPRNTLNMLMLGQVNKINNRITKKGMDVKVGKEQLKAFNLPHQKQSKMAKVAIQEWVSLSKPKDTEIIKMGDKMVMVLGKSKAP